MRLSGARVGSMAIAALALVAVTVAAWTWYGRVRADSVQSFGTVPDFSLVERSGKTVRRADLLGKVAVVDFFYTRCTDACPLQSAHMARLQETFAGARDFLLVSITVDPDHDGAEILRSYAATFHADAARWLFLTGPRDAIYRLAVDGFHLAVIASVQTDEAPRWAWLSPSRAWAHDGEANHVIQLTHASWFALVDRQGRIRGYFDGTDWDGVKRLETEVETLLGARR